MTRNKITIRPFYIMRSQNHGKDSTGHDREGAILATGRVVVTWVTNTNDSHGSFSDLDGLKALCGADDRTRFVFAEDDPNWHLKTFYLERTQDITGNTGKGIVAEGVEFSNHWCILNWLGKPYSEFWYPTLQDIERIHSHGGLTKIIWDDRAN